MNPENLSIETLSLFNQLPADARREACNLAESMPEEEAVYITLLRNLPNDKKRQLLFSLSKKKWGL